MDARWVDRLCAALVAFAVLVAFFLFWYGVKLSG